MPKFMMLYKGPQADPASFTPEQRKMVMAQWNAWFAKMGKAVVDSGAPLGLGTSVMDNGKDGMAATMNGYSVVEAKDMKAAKAMTKGHPLLTEGKGRNAIDIFEMMPAPGM